MTPLVLAGCPARFCRVCGGKELVRLVTYDGTPRGWLVPCPHSNHEDGIGLPIYPVPFRVDQPRRAS
jgi:hypothetical protein